MEAQARSLREMWEHKTGERLGAAWEAAFADWIRKFGFSVVADAVQAVAARRCADIVAFAEEPAGIRDVPAYSAVAVADEREPGARHCYLIRGLMRKKFFCTDDAQMLEILIDAMRSGMSESAMYRAVEDNETLEDCYAALGVERSPLINLLDAMKGQKVFVREDEPEWQIWVAYFRKTTGRGPPMNKQFGWYFPTRLPPDLSPDRPARRRRA